MFWGSLIAIAGGLLLLAIAIGMGFAGTGLIVRGPDVVGIQPTSSAVLAGLERMTGLSLLRDISTLATDFGIVSPGFKERAQRIRGLLRASDTRYVLLAAPDPHGASDILKFAAEVDRAGVFVDAVVVNRVLRVPEPAAGRSPDDEAGAGAERRSGRERPRWSATLARHLVACAKDLETLRAAQQAVVEQLRAGLAAIDERAGRGAGRTRSWVELPALTPAPTSLAGIVALARALGEAEGITTTAA